MIDQVTGIYCGVDTHKDRHIAAVVDHTGRMLGAESFVASPEGHRASRGWMRAFGPVVKVGVEGTSFYGVGLARHLMGAGLEVVEVIRPNHQIRRRHGKSDTVDAEAAARAALSGDAVGAPKGNDGIVSRSGRFGSRCARPEPIAPACPTRSAISAPTAPDQLSADLEPLITAHGVRRCARFRPGDLAQPAEATKAYLRSLAANTRPSTPTSPSCAGTSTISPRPPTRHCAPPKASAQTPRRSRWSQPATTHRLRSEASFAARSGGSPVEASSGMITRHRLNTGGNRQANHALWRIAMVRLCTDADTRAYARRRQTDSRTRRETIRCLKRYIARGRPTAHQTPTRRPHQQPARTPPKRRSHPPTRRRLPQHLAQHRLQNRTRHHTQPPPRARLPRLARTLTPAA